MGGHRSLPDLDDLIAEVDRTCATAFVPGAQQPDWIELLRSATTIAARLRVLGDELVEEYLEHCRQQGRPWCEVAEALAARQLVAAHAPVSYRQYAPEEIAGELRAAMHDMKAAAVGHANNFVGTEHVLFGLVARESSATRLLASLGASCEALRRALAESFGPGASPAAGRIAWTPYARRALALAKDVAGERGAGAIGCGHVLVGLARLDAGVAAEVLRGAGVDVDALAVVWAVPAS